MKLEEEAAKLASRGDGPSALAIEALARDFALAVLRKAEETRGVRLSALEKATIVDRAAGGE